VARRYFGKPAKELTVPEAALLAGLPKSPVSLMPLDHPEAALARRNHVLRRMRTEGYLTEPAYLEALRQPLGARWHEFPRLSPHLAMELRPKITDGARLKTTLDRDLQVEAEALVGRRMPVFKGEITNAALIVIDVPTASVLARVGSVDFFGTPGGGQVDACRARRSPGSALKPFTYALAMERNCLYASEMLQDGSLDYGLYNPENYDGRYRGLVSATYALKRSLNVPAVAVVDRIGVQHLHTYLRKAGLATLNRPADHYGLGLTLGNCEVRLEELATAYCMLANLGEYRPLRVLTDGPAPTGERLVSPGTCRVIRNMLESPLPDEFAVDVVHATGVPRKASWKTGTSAGHHDAWSFVFNDDYVVGVWLGNNDATPSNWLVGGRAALPLAGRMFRKLKPRTESGHGTNGYDDMRTVEVCAVSGLPASSWCPHTRTVTLPRNQYLHRRCAVHWPAANGGVAECWPGTAKGWDLANVTPTLATRERLRAPAPDTALARMEKLRILTPTDAGEYVITGEHDADRLRLRASIEREGALHWYLDEVYLGQSVPETPLYLELTPGAHALTCMTPTGALDTVRFGVTLPSSGNLHFKD
jgi:penicillin-binding protein 1C